MGFFSSIEHDVDSAADKVEKWVGNGVKDIGKAGKFVINKGTGVIGGVEDTLFFPLILIAVGGMFFLRNSNLGQAAEVAKNAGPLLA